MTEDFSRADGNPIFRSCGDMNCYGLDKHNAWLLWVGRSLVDLKLAVWPLPFSLVVGRRINNGKVKDDSLSMTTATGMLEN